ncbi:hypothetical protein HHI36_019568, partial [Cryptolaemus montrouzieri]
MSWCRLYQIYIFQLATNDKLSKEIDKIKYKLGTEMNINAQSLLSKNVILKGITKENHDENIKEIVATLAEKLSIPIDDLSIMACFRLGNAKKGDKNPIKVIFK